MKYIMAIPSDPDSLELAIKTVHLQTSTWLRCCNQSIQNLVPEKFGWKLTDGERKPLCGLMEINFPRRLLDAGRENKLIVIMQIAKVVSQMKLLLKINLEPRNLLLSQGKQSQLPGERKRDIKRKTMLQRITCYHKTPWNNTACNASSEKCWKIQTFCQVTIHVTSGYSEDYYYMLLFLLL